MAKHVHIHVIDAGWEEDKHKRSDDGKFSSSGGGGGSKPQGVSSEARASLEKKHPEMKAMRKHSEGLSKATGVEHQISRGSNGKFYVTRASGSVSQPDMSGKPHELKEWKKLSKIGGGTTLQKRLLRRHQLTTRLRRPVRLLGRRLFPRQR